jgi:hypothetical protein
MSTDTADLTTPASQSAIRDPRSAIEDWRRPLLFATGIVLGLRVVLSVWAAYVGATMPPAEVDSNVTGIVPQSGTLAAPWQHEDALWYEKIATVGYAPDDGSTAFLPLLPLLMRVLSVPLLGDIALAGLLVSLIASILALALLFRLAAIDWSEGAAGRAVLYLALFPTALFLLSAYTEALFLALSVGAFYLARRGEWYLAALLAALAGLTKAQGALIAIPLAIEYLMASGWRLREALRTWYRLAAVVLAAPLATLLFFAYTRFSVGDPLFWSERVTAMWSQKSSLPWETLAIAAQRAFGEGRFSINTFDLIVLLLFLGLAAYSFRLRPSYGAQALTVLLPSLLRVGPALPLMSVSRYALVAFPCFIALAVWLERKPRALHVGLITFSICLLLVWSSQFVRGFWVG